jgi:hypothetical protein
MIEAVNILRFWFRSAHPVAMAPGSVFVLARSGDSSWTRRYRFLFRICVGRGAGLPSPGVF